MSAACYICQGSSSSSRSVSTVGSQGDPIGACGLCSIFACGFHALRNTSPERWECILCVLAHIAPPPGGGGGPTTPPDPLGSLGVIEGAELTYAGVSPDLVNNLQTAVERADEVVINYYAQARPSSYVSFYRDPDPQSAIPHSMRDYNRTRLAAAIALIEFCGLDQALLNPHLRQRPDLAVGRRLEFS